MWNGGMELDSPCRGNTPLMSPLSRITLLPSSFTLLHLVKAPTGAAIRLGACLPPRLELSQTARASHASPAQKEMTRHAHNSRTEEFVLRWGFPAKFPQDRHVRPGRDQRLSGGYLPR